MQDEIDKKAQKALNLLRTLRHDRFTGWTSSVNFLTVLGSRVNWWGPTRTIHDLLDKLLNLNVFAQVVLFCLLKLLILRA